jgi:hypothetical protein
LVCCLFHVAIKLLNIKQILNKKTKPDRRINWRKVGVPDPFHTPKGRLFKPSNSIWSTLSLPNIWKKGHLCIQKGTSKCQKRYFAQS